MKVQIPNRNNSSLLSLPGERIVLIDSLRGYALMGLFLVHMIEYYELYWLKPVESSYKDVIFAFFGGKAYAIFALLFGVSFYIISSSAQKKGTDFLRLLFRRFFLLLIAGMLHGLIYGGDILLLLAIVGLLLLAVYRLPVYLLLILAVIFLLQIPGVIYTARYIAQNRHDYDLPLHWSLYPPTYKIYAEGAFSELISINLTKGIWAKCVFMLESGRLFTIADLSILGFWLGSVGFFRKKTHDKKRYGLCLLVSALLAVVLYFFKPGLSLTLHAERSWMVRSLMDSYLSLAYTLVSIFAFVFLYQFEPVKNVFKPLAPCGRMSLTLYVFQSIFLVPFFYGFGLGAYSFIGQANSFLAGVGLWFVQIIFCHLWFRRYQYGPLEWLWRSATYLKKDIQFKRFKEPSLP